jgi:hypothetical protein
VQTWLLKLAASAENMLKCPAAMSSRWIRCLALLALACSESEPNSNPNYCDDPDYTICGSPLPALDEQGMPWLSYSQDLLEICGNDSFIETSLGYCDDGKRVLNRSTGFVGDTRFYDGETLVGRRAQGDDVVIIVTEPECICAGQSFQGTIASVSCRVTSAEMLCGRRGTPFIADRNLGFEPSLNPGYCPCDPSLLR